MTESNSAESKSSEAGKDPNPAQVKQQLQDSVGAPTLGDEQELWSGNYSVKSMAGSWIVLGLATIAAFALLMMFAAGSTVVWVVLGILAVVWVGMLGLMYYRKWSYHYELTTQRIKHREGFVFRSQDRIELIDISDVKLKQGPIQTILNVGNIHVISSDESHPLLVMAGLADAKKVADLIDNARREERRKRGLHIHSI